MATASEFKEPELLKDRRLRTLALEECRMEKRLLVCSPSVGFASVTSRASNAGDFDRLPVELVYEIFSGLDFASLISLRKSSVKAFELVSSYLPFSGSMTHASASLRAIKCVGSLRHVNAFQFFSLMRTTKCSRCDVVAPFIFIPEIRRVCWNCIERCQIFRVPTVKVCYGLEDSHFDSTVATFKTFPGKYGEPWRTFSIIQHLITGPELMKARLKADNNDMILVHERTRAITTAFQNAHNRWQAKMNEFNQMPNAAYIFPPREPLTWDKKLNEHTGQYKYMLTTTLPFIDVPARVIQPHRYCAGCIYERYIFKTRHKNLINYDDAERIELETLFRACRAWLIEDLEKHLEECVYAQILERRGATTTIFKCV